MRKAISLGMAVAAILVVAVVTPATAVDPIVPTFRLETDHFQCLSSNRVQNVGRNDGEIPTWGATAPTQTLQEGGGCVQYENLLTTTGSYTSEWDLAFEGTFTGNLKNITFEIYFTNLPASTLPEVTANANLLIDGEVVHTAAQTAFPPQPAGNLKKLIFSYTKLEKRFATENGDGETERTIGLSFSSFNDAQNVFAWGATDAPSKITFNPATTVGMKFPVG